ncbi:MAG: GDP-mannose 4,6-dehydratase [Vulcanimicrobiaceae bacterium]|jgi:UDP-glucose 4-epimerase
MRILITGGAGFIGSHLAEACIRDGHNVCILDDLSSGSLENVAHLVGNPRFRGVIGNIQDAELVGKQMDECDIVYHLAAAIGMKLILAQPLQTIETNVRGTEIVLAQAALRNKRLLFASTSEVYGLNEHKPSLETDNVVIGAPSKARWTYAGSKVLDEFLAFAYYREKGLPVTIVRLFNTVGTRQTGRYGMVVPTFIKQALSGEPLTVHGDGQQTRCFADVDEIAAAMIALINNPGAIGEAYNLGTNEETTILNLAKRVIKKTNSKSEIVFVSHDVAYEIGFDEIQRRIPDIRKVAAVTGFSPKTTLDEILGKVIGEFTSRLVPA